GHGTHVASIITGEDAKYEGVAPDTKLLNGKVLNDQGFGSESGIIAGMQWAASKGAKVVNMSLGSPLPSDGTDPLSLAVNDITAAKATHGRIGSPVDATHVGMSGTSMATPHVAGAAAILAGEHPDWKADQLKNALMGRAKPNPTLSVFEQGAGRVDVAKAVTQ